MPVSNINSNSAVSPLSVSNSSGAAAEVKDTASSIKTQAVDAAVYERSGLTAPASGGNERNTQVMMTPAGVYTPPANGNADERAANQMQAPERAAAVMENESELVRDTVSLNSAAAENATVAVNTAETDISLQNNPAAQSVFTTNTGLYSNTPQAETGPAETAPASIDQTV